VKSRALMLMLLFAARASAQDTPVGLFDRVESAWSERRLADYLALWSFPNAEARQAEEFLASDAFSAGETRLTIDRPERATTDTRLMVVARTLDIREPRGRLDQWRLRLELTAAGWRIVGREPLGSIDGLVHLTLDPHGFRADGLTLTLPDFEVHFEQGTLFTSPESLGPTVAVFVGRARVRFAPRLPTEREQLRQFAGQQELVERVEQVFVRLHPADWQRVLAHGQLQPDRAAPGRWAAAQRLFQAQAARSYVLDTELQRGPWWVLPAPGDALVTFRARKSLLTFSVNDGQAEAISLFDRDNRRQICLYPAEGHDTRYNEDELRASDVLEHHLRVRFETDGSLSGSDTLRIQMRSPVSTLRLRLRESLRVLSVTSRAGSHLFSRVRNQSTVMVTLGPLTGQSEISLTVRYAGPLTSERTAEDALQAEPTVETFELRNEFPFDRAQVFSGHTLWYPQVEADDHAVAEMEFDVPVGWAAVAGGTRETRPSSDPKRSVAAFHLQQPAKYLAVAVGRLEAAAQGEASGVHLQVWATARKRREAAELLQRARDILSFYVESFGPCPYSNLNLVLQEGEVPGGHGPAGLVVLSERPPRLTGELRDDPATLWQIPGFFLAHELAHQWWGQGVAGQNYHERWLTEGSAQYAAALWSRHAYGADTFDDILRHFGRWALRTTGEGPIHLGQRLGHLKRDPQIYRALAYNKGAYVLHMLRALVGEEPFLRALRNFQERYRYAKAGTDDLRAVLEGESGRDLKPYFDAWIYGTTVPLLRVEQQVTGAAKGGGFVTSVTVQGTNVPGPLPLQIALRQDAGTTLANVVLTPGGNTFKLETRSRPTGVELNADHGLLVLIRKR
jgi:Peptidase family M1 domain